MTTTGSAFPSASGVFAVSCARNDLGHSFGSPPACDSCRVEPKAEVDPGGESGTLEVVILRPTQSANDHTLLGFVEASAAKTDARVASEGYRLPRHPRMEVLEVTHDSRVIEVNIHAPWNWKGLVGHSESS